MSYTIGIIVFDGVLTAEVTGPAEVFAVASKRDWFKGTKVLLIGIEQQTVICTEEGIRLSVDGRLPMIWPWMSCSFPVAMT